MQDYDLATDKDGDLPSKPEKSERALMKVMRHCQKPIALFIDDGHDLALQEGTCDNTPQWGIQREFFPLAQEAIVIP